MADTNKVKFGLKNVTVFPITDAVVEGVATETYGSPISIRGAVSLSMDPDGDLVKEYADDTIYWAGNASNDYSGTLEIERVPVAFETGLLGMTVDATTGEVQETESSQPMPFGLVFQVNGDKNKGRIYRFARCYCRRIGVGANTKNDNLTFDHDTLELVGGKNLTGFSKGHMDEGDAGYATALTAWTYTAPQTEETQTETQGEGGTP